MPRPWPVDAEIWGESMMLFTTWLATRGGVCVYECHVLDSSQRGMLSFMPARYIAEDEQFHDAPAHIGDLPSQRKERVDHVRLQDFGGDISAAISACFARRDAPKIKDSRKRNRRKP